MPHRNLSEHVIFPQNCPLPVFTSLWDDSFINLTLLLETRKQWAKSSKLSDSQQTLPSLYALQPIFFWLKRWWPNFTCSNLSMSSTIDCGGRVIKKISMPLEDHPVFPVAGHSRLVPSHPTIYYQTIKILSSFLISSLFIFFIYVNENSIPL